MATIRSITTAPALAPARYDTSYARGVAVLFVTNSHLEAFYPQAWLADGGLIGLTLFFACSGIGLALSRSTKTRTAPFLTWYRQRLLRIYPSLWVTLVLLPIAWSGHWRDWSTSDYVYHLVYPTTYQFITKIVVYYLAVYGLIRCLAKRYQTWIMIGVAAACVGAAVPDMQALLEHPQPLKTGQLSQPLLWLIFLWTTLAGVWIANHLEWFRRPLSSWDGLLVTSLTLTYVVAKLAMSRYAIHSEFFLLYFAVGIAWSLQLLRILSSAEMRKIVEQIPLVSRALAGLGRISLEVYLVHIQLYQWPVWQFFAFPLNIVVFGAVSVVLAAFVHESVDRLTAIVVRRVKRVTTEIVH